MDAERQARYWRESALDDLDTAALLIRHEKINQGLFFAHLALEKGLKGVVCYSTRSTPPFTHNLSRLAQISGVAFSAEQQKIIAQTSTFNLRGRYELPAKPLMTGSEAAGIIDEIGELVRWLSKP